MTLGSYAPPSLAGEGFIHCSTEAQMLETAGLHFVGHEELLILHLEPTRLAADLKWEASRGGALFPHIFRALRADDPVAESRLTRAQSGDWQWLR